MVYVVDVCVWFALQTKPHKRWTANENQPPFGKLSIVCFCSRAMEWMRGRDGYVLCCCCIYTIYIYLNYPYIYIRIHFTTPKKKFICICIIQTHRDSKRQYHHMCEQYFYIFWSRIHRQNNTIDVRVNHPYIIYCRTIKFIINLPTSFCPINIWYVWST